MVNIGLWRFRRRHYDCHYPVWKRNAAHRLITRGMKAKAKNARAAHARGKMDERAWLKSGEESAIVRMIGLAASVYDLNYRLAEESF